MPYSLKELEQYMGVTERMGTAYVPFTFPTVTVANNMQAAGAKSSNANVDRFWNAYKEATMTDGLPPYDGDMTAPNPARGVNNAAILKALVDKTGLSKSEAAAWLNATWKAVTEQGWNYEWIDPAGAHKAQAGNYSLSNPVESIKTAASDLGTVAKNLIAPTADSVTNLVKYAALAVAGGAIVYGLYTWNKSKKRKRVKGG